MNNLATFTNGTISVLSVCVYPMSSVLPLLGNLSPNGDFKVFLGKEWGIRTFGEFWGNLRTFGLSLMSNVLFFYFHTHSFDKFFAIRQFKEKINSVDYKYLYQSYGENV